MYDTTMVQLPDAPDAPDQGIHKSTIKSRRDSQIRPTSGDCWSNFSEIY